MNKNLVSEQSFRYSASHRGCRRFLHHKDVHRYGYFDDCEQLGLDFVVRRQHNRRITQSSAKLHSYMRN